MNTARKPLTVGDTVGEPLERFPNTATPVGLEESDAQPDRLIDAAEDRGEAADARPEKSTKGS